ncbi:hypothetical protein [Gemmata massiliana]|nr:hypothetical protein [Gemmata massiliana]
MHEFLRNALLVGAVFGVTALVLEIPLLDAGVQRATDEFLDWVALNRVPSLVVIALGLAVLISAARLNGKGDRA